MTRSIELVRNGWSQRLYQANAAAAGKLNAMSVAKKHVFEFSPNGGKLFALIDEHGILRIWDAESNSLKQESTLNLQLSGPCTALTWISVSATAPRAKKSRKSQHVASESLYIALGTLKGSVSLYSFAEGKIERTLKGESHDGAITSIAYDNAGHLYTAGADCRILVWSIAEERCLKSWQVGPEKPKNIVYMPISRTLAVGSRQLKVFDVESEELVETFTGHTTEINAICSLAGKNGIEYAITSARMERIICFWKLDKKGRNKAATCTLLMEDLAYCLACEAHSDGQVRVASVTRNGNIHIYLLNLESLSAEKCIKPKVSLQIASDCTDTVQPIHAVAAYFDHDANRSHEILFAYGSQRSLQFERFTPNYAEKLNVIVRADPNKLYAKKPRHEQPGTQAALMTQTPIVHTKDVEYNSALPVSKKKVQNDVPMEARLQSLKLHATKLSDGKMQTQSKTQLLMQALHSKNQIMLNTVLSTHDAETIQLTLDRLPIEYVNPLVNELTLMLQGKHTNIMFALHWLRVLISTHTSVLMSEDKEELRDKLGVCLGVASQRMHCLTDALQINGRVNLIINQMKRNADSHLNENNVLQMEDEDDAFEQSIEFTTAENNSSDLEDYNSSQLNIFGADDDLAIDEDDVEITENSENEDEDENTDTDESAG